MIIMLSVAIIFLFFSGIAFLGFLINAFFYKTKISSILPLMAIGVVVGPVLQLVNTTPGSFAAAITPYISAVAVAFVLFDVGINIRIDKLTRVFAKATEFAFLTAAMTAIVLAIMAYLLFGWSLLESFIFGFAVCGPSVVIVPTLLNLIKVNPELKVSLLYESVLTDVLQLAVPLILVGFIINPVAGGVGLAAYVFTTIFGSIFLGVLSAFFWLYVMKRYSQQSASYSWMLTMAMVIATYGLASAMNISGVIAVFAFGLSFSNIGGSKNVKEKKDFLSHFTFESDMQIRHIRNYQREIVFFASTFFFVYIGMLFNLSGVDLDLLFALGFMVALIATIRYFMSGRLGVYFSKDNPMREVEHRTVYYNVARGLAPAIVATVPLSLGISIPYFLDSIFIIILLTNVVSTIGFAYSYRGVNLKTVKVSRRKKREWERKLGLDYID